MQGFRRKAGPLFRFGREAGRGWGEGRRIRGLERTSAGRSRPAPRITREAVPRAGHRASGDQRPRGRDLRLACAAGRPSGPTPPPPPAARKG